MYSESVQTLLSAEAGQYTEEDERVKSSIPAVTNSSEQLPRRAGLGHFSITILCIVTGRVYKGFDANNIAQPKQINGLALDLIFHRFSPLNC